MFKLKIQNPNGNMLVLTDRETDYQVIKIEGLNPTPAQINTTDIANLDGALYNSSRLDTKNIVLTVVINGDVEANRQRLYLFMRTKELCTIYYSNENRDVYIDGYVETFLVDPFAEKQTAQISILCPSPFFTGLDEIVTDISNVMNLFHFPFAINIGEPVTISEYSNSRITNVYNDSESDTGVIIYIDIQADISSITIRNVETGQEITLDYEFLTYDQVTINTNKGHKSVFLLRNGVTTNIFTALRRGSEFFQLAVGDNLFGYLVDDGLDDQKVFISFVRHNIYRGV